MTVLLDGGKAKITRIEKASGVEEFYNEKEATLDVIINKNKCKAETDKMQKDEKCERKKNLNAQAKLCAT